MDVIRCLYMHIQLYNIPTKVQHNTLSFTHIAVPQMFSYTNMYTKNTHGDGNMFPGQMPNEGFLPRDNTFFMHPEYNTKVLLKEFIFHLFRVCMQNM